eukprot:CAMPEP_0170566552 /NCGR_PEP_ID=MMETSP0211-20121228/79918_1 /TAXON_ID=311385 /ORGANISM="Pseudokeronopsis sp., Strain OXSARD2" /LENGTH=89 /DNA_ID=CAMNT_0010887767 /DNA_START=43 /DNA_END=309 /DNA_ORIENTATION=-
MAQTRNIQQQVIQNSLNNPSNNLKIKRQNYMKIGGQEQVTYSNPQLCAEYAQEIQTYLKNQEKCLVTNPNYMANQNELNDRMRSILIDW